LSSFASSEELNLEEREESLFTGSSLHRVPGRGHRPGLEEVIRQVSKESNVDYPIDPVKKEILDFLRHREVRPYFVPKLGRVVGREQEFSDPEGNLLRMDRVIMDEDRITVMDYKTGGEKKAEEKYFLQLKNYIRILKDLYPGREVAGLVAYVDLKEVVKVRMKAFLIFHYILIEEIVSHLSAPAGTTPPASLSFRVKAVSFLERPWQEKEERVSCRPVFFDG
jgi:hypothetical protein